MWLKLQIIFPYPRFGPTSSIMKLWHVTSQKGWRKKAMSEEVQVWVGNGGLKLDLWQNLFGVRHNETGFINTEWDVWARRWWPNWIKCGFSHVTVITETKVRHIEDDNKVKRRGGLEEDNKVKTKRLWEWRGVEEVQVRVGRLSFQPCLWGRLGFLNCLQCVWAPVSHNSECVCVWICPCCTVYP